MGHSTPVCTRRVRWVLFCQGPSTLCPTLWVSRLSFDPKVRILITGKGLGDDKDGVTGVQEVRVQRIPVDNVTVSHQSRDYFGTGRGPSCYDWARCRDYR